MIDRPLVVTIGAMKCGTSSLHAYMRLHPEIHMSRKKELDYFKLPKPPLGGPSWYRAQLRGPGKVAGESSPNYTKRSLFPGVPERMHAAVPDARLIYIVRDPVERAVSHYRHNLSHGRETRETAEAFANTGAGNHYLETSRYHQQLSYFLALYPDEQLLVLDMDALRADPRSVMKRVFAFVGVDAGFDHPDIGKVFHDSSAKGRPNALGQVIHDIPLVRQLRYALPAVFEAPLDKPVLTPELRARVSEALAPDVEALRAYTGEAFGGWSL